MIEEQRRHEPLFLPAAVRAFTGGQLFAAQVLTGGWPLAAVAIARHRNRFTESGPRWWTSPKSKAQKQG